jgi:glycosyltransferase involved in cell wall biosynthesis
MLLEPFVQNRKQEAEDGDLLLGTGREKMKKTILILIGSYLPGFKVGGPIQSIAALVQALSDEYDFKVICGDRDLGDDKPFPNEPVGRWYDYGSAKVLRIPPGVIGGWMLIRTLRSDDYDILYLSGILSRTYSMLPLLCRRANLLPNRPIVVAPRGELSTGALGIKPLRKRLYLALSKLIGLFDRVLWQASTHRENNDILTEFGAVNVREAAAIVRPLSISDQAHLHDQRIIIASDLLPKDAESAAQREGISKASGSLRVVTIGRVCQMKNIDYAISLVKQLHGLVNYDIYGPLEDKEYLALCKRLCVNLPDGITVQFMGGIPHDNVHPILNNYHVFLLPTLGENFGHAISEAMQVGCVPIISDRTPWQNLQDADAGWSLPLSKPEAFTDALKTALTWSQEELQQRSKNVTEHAANHAVSQDGIRENRSLFAAAMVFKRHSQ